MRKILLAVVVLVAALAVPSNAYAVGNVYCHEHSGAEFSMLASRDTGAVGQPSSNVTFQMWSPLAGWVYLYASGYDVDDDGTLDPVDALYLQRSNINRWVEWQVPIRAPHSFHLTQYADTGTSFQGVWVSSGGHGNHCASQSTGTIPGS